MTTAKTKYIFVVHDTWRAMIIIGFSEYCNVYAARNAQNNTFSAMKSEPLKKSSLDMENTIFDALDEASNRTAFQRKFFYEIHHGRNHQ